MTLHSVCGQLGIHGKSQHESIGIELPSTYVVCILSSHVAWVCHEYTS